MGNRFLRKYLQSPICCFNLFRSTWSNLKGLLVKTCFFYLNEDFLCLSFSRPSKNYMSINLIVGTPHVWSFDTSLLSRKLLTCSVPQICIPTLWYTNVIHTYSIECSETFLTLSSFHFQNRQLPPKFIQVVLRVMCLEYSLSNKA